MQVLDLTSKVCTPCLREVNFVTPKSRIRISACIKYTRGVSRRKLQAILRHVGNKCRTLHIPKRTNNFYSRPQCHLVSRNTTRSAISKLYTSSPVPNGTCDPALSTPPTFRVPNSKNPHSAHAKAGLVFCPMIIIDWLAICAPNCLIAGQTDHRRYKR